MSADEAISEDPCQPVAAGFLYRVTVAFPGWAGAILAVYSIFSYRVGDFRIRQK